MFIKIKDSIKHILNIFIIKDTFNQGILNYEKIKDIFNSFRVSRELHCF